jgi:hypothetical protein
MENHKLLEHNYDYSVLTQLRRYLCSFTFHNSSVRYMKPMIDFRAITIYEFVNRGRETIVVLTSKNSEKLQELFQNGMSSHFSVLLIVS